MRRFSYKNVQWHLIPTRTRTRTRERTTTRTQRCSNSEREQIRTKGANAFNYERRTQQRTRTHVFRTANTVHIQPWYLDVYINRFFWNLGVQIWLSQVAAHLICNHRVMSKQTTTNSNKHGLHATYFENKPSYIFCETDCFCLTDSQLANPSQPLFWIESQQPICGWWATS